MENFAKRYFAILFWECSKWDLRVEGNNSHWHRTKNIRMKEITWQLWNVSGEIQLANLITEKMRPEDACDTNTVRANNQKYPHLAMRLKLHPKSRTNKKTQFRPWSSEKKTTHTTLISLLNDSCTCLWRDQDSSAQSSIQNDSRQPIPKDTLIPSSAKMYYVVIFFLLAIITLQVRMFTWLMFTWDVTQFHAVQMIECDIFCYCSVCEKKAGDKWLAHITPCRVLMIN